MRRERTVRNVNGTSEIWKESFVDIRSCFKFIPRQIETHVEVDWSPRCETGAQYGRNIPVCNDNIISQ